MFSKKQLAAGALAASLTALTPQFAAAGDVQTCSRVANDLGIHQYTTQQGTLGFQEGRGLGCEYEAIGGQWRTLKAFDLNDSRERTRFYNDWDRAQRVAERLSESNRRRDPAGLGSANDTIRQLDRTARSLNSFLKTIERFGK